MIRSCGPFGSKHQWPKSPKNPQCQAGNQRQLTGQMKYLGGQIILGFGLFGVEEILFFGQVKVVIGWDGAGGCVTKSGVALVELSGNSVAEGSGGLQCHGRAAIQWISSVN